jgi:hypothetical protein
MSVLYYFPGDKASEEAATFARACSGIKILDVSTLKAIPNYVDGVPLLADEYNEFRGTSCLKRLQEMAKDGTGGDGIAAAMPLSERGVTTNISDLGFTGKAEFSTGSIGPDAVSNYMQARQRETVGHLKRK